MKKKIISLLVGAVLTFSSISAFAFPDMEDSTWDWARGAVDEMVEIGIIKGYSDNTFRPGNNITKGEAMVLFSRVIGYTAEGNQEYINSASEVYEDELKNLSTPYKGEIAYLLYKGILTEDSYKAYAADNVVNTPLKRYEAAEFLTKIATNNADVTGSATELEFTDAADITNAMAPYIKYVSENKIMLGMDGGNFVPNGDVTRAQMTVMLSRILPVIDYEYIDGEVKFYNSATDSVIINTASGEEKEIELIDSAIIKIDGLDAAAETLLAGSKVRVTLSDDILVAIETLSPSYDAEVSGKFKQLEVISANVNGIQIIDMTTGLTSTYSLSKGVTVTKNGKSISAANLIKDDYVILTIKEGMVVSVSAESKMSTFSGKVTNISLSPKYTITVLTGSTSKTLDVSSSVDVTRNKKDASLSNILVGDNVEITTTYGVITEIVATSKTSVAEGSITEVVISNTPAITIADSKGNEYTYAIKSSAKLTLKDAPITFYDLRVGDKVKLNLDASTVTTLEVVAAFNNGAPEGSSATISGIVEYVNKEYKYIKLVGSAELIFLSDASITDSTGKALSIKSIEIGDAVTAFGTAQTGSYSASMLVVQK